jgi:hypothetical protein
LEIHVFILLSCVDLFGTKRTYVNLGKHMLQEVFLSKT